MTVPTTGLAGFLFSKAHALVKRGEDKDFYDLVYVLRHCDAGGPAAAAHVIREGPLRNVIQETEAVWEGVASLFVDAHTAGAGHYAHFAHLVDRDADSARFRNDAVLVVDTFITHLLH